MTTLDPRLNAYRPDLAAAELRGKVEAARFVEPVVNQVVHGQAPLRREPRHDAPLDTEALFGERVKVYDIDDEGWAWVQLATDRYVGYLPAAALMEGAGHATHKVAVLRTHAFPAPDIKTPPFIALPLGSQVVVAREQSDFAVTSTGLYLPPAHLAAMEAFEPDFVAVAERFVGTPYLWGGKTTLGIDCSGLVQVSLQVAGISSPRDSYVQQVLGRLIKAELQRGDLMFWKGHVAIARDGSSAIHANAHHMMVAIEPISKLFERIGAPVAVRRL